MKNYKNGAKALLAGMAAMARAFGIMVIGCDNDNGGSTNDNNSFVGEWTQDDSNGTVKVTFTNTEWTATVSGNVYNKGTYTSENPSTWTVTGGTAACATGTATIAYGKMTVTNFTDSNMNGTYTKQ